MTATVLKSWGASNPGKIANLITDVIRVNRGGYSSVHYHETLANVFILVEGALDVLRGDRTLGTHELRNRGDSCLVVARETHQFYALLDSVLVEAYLDEKLVDWESPPPYDIKRLSQNGFNSEQQVLDYLDGKKPRWIGYSCSDK